MCSHLHDNCRINVYKIRSQYKRKLWQGRKSG